LSVLNAQADPMDLKLGTIPVIQNQETVKSQTRKTDNTAGLIRQCVTRMSTVKKYYSTIKNKYSNDKQDR
jgi:hypothetical protein